MVPRMEAAFSELQGLLEDADEAHEKYEQLACLTPNDTIFQELALHYVGRTPDEVKQLVEDDVQELIDSWSAVVDETDERIAVLRELLDDAGYDIDQWIVSNRIKHAVTTAENDPVAKRLRREVDSALEKNNPVRQMIGNEERIRPIGASGFVHKTTYDEELAHVDDLEDDVAAGGNDIAPDRLRVYTKKSDQNKLEEDDDDVPDEEFVSGAAWEGGFRISPQLVSALKDYQLSCVAFLIERLCDNKGSLVAHGMGLGKTFTVLATLTTLHTTGKLHAIVACPASMVFPWCHEISKWTHRGIVSLGVYPVDKSDSFTREHQNWLSNGGVLIMSHEMLKRSLQQLTHNSRVTNNTVLIFDEAHLLKSPNTQLYKAVDGMPTERRILLTGTPLQNHLKEYFAMVHLISPGTLGTKMSEFNKLYGTDIERGMLKESTDDQIAKSKRAVVRLKKSVEAIMHSVPSSLLRDMLPKKYEFRLLHAVDEFESRGGGVIVERHELHSHAMICKAHLVVDLIDKIRLYSSDDRILVFSPYLDILTMCEAKRKGFILTGDASQHARDALIREFNKPGDGVLYASTGAGGVGVDFSVANRVIVTDASWNPAVDAQAIARAWRMGQKKDTFVYRLIGHQTLEERMLRLQVMKTSLAMRVMEEHEITRFYSEADLKHMSSAEIEDANDLNAADVAQIDRPLAALMMDDVELGVSSHDDMFLDDEVELSQTEMARAMNEMTQAMFEDNMVRQISMPDGSVQAVAGFQTHFRGSYDGSLVPPFKPLSVTCTLNELEIAAIGKNKVPFHPEVTFSRDNLFLCLGPCFPPEEGDPFVIEVEHTSARRWQKTGTWSAHNDLKFKKIHYKVQLSPGEYRFKARFVGKKKVGDWSEETGIVTVE